MKKLTRDERCQIAALLNGGKSPSAIAKQLDRSASTITREIKRNSDGGQYNFDKADFIAGKRRGQ